MTVRRTLAVVGVLATLLVAPATTRAAAAPVPEGVVVGYGVAAGEAPAGDGVVALASSSLGSRWWASTAVGRVTTGGGAAHVGDLRDAVLNQPVVGIAATASGGGYWLVAADGGVFTFGDAPFLGSTGGLRLQRPIVGMAATPSGRGYWLVAADGGVFTFGDARFLGSTGGLRLQRPVVGMAATPSGGGYWLVAADGGVFTFGDAPFAGAGPDGAVGLAGTTTGRGYRVAAADGRVTVHGDARHLGDLAGRVPDASVAAIAGAGAAGYRLVTAGVRDRLDLWEPGGLRHAAQDWALRVASRAGARATVWHRGTLGLLTVRRGDAVVQSVPSGWRVPMATLAVEPGPSLPLLGREVTSVLQRGEVAMGRASARLRGAAVGDVVDLLGWDGRIHSRRIGILADDRRSGSAEIVLGIADATAMGFRRPSTVLVWGASRAALGSAMGEEPPPVRMGLDRSWVPTGRDGVASTVRLKEVLGEVTYRPSGGGDGVVLHPGWTPAIVTESVPVLGRVTCHRAAIPALRGALREVAEAGLGGTLGSYGGCYNPRLIRGGDSGGALSRHSFGIAIDVNVSRNSFGGRVEMHPRVVDIFRRWGFAWGGTWVRTDGMHFEWVP